MNRLLNFGSWPFVAVGWIGAEALSVPLKLYFGKEIPSLLAGFMMVIWGLIGIYAFFLSYLPFYLMITATCLVGILFWRGVVVGVTGAMNSMSLGWTLEDGLARPFFGKAILIATISVLAAGVIFYFIRTYLWT